MHQYSMYYLFAINIVSFFLYGIDKYKAKKNKWRISEATLLMIAERCAPKSQDFVDYRTHKTGKMLPHVKYSSKRSDFLRFYAYLCHVIDDFCLS